MLESGKFFRASNLSEVVALLRNTRALNIAVFSREDSLSDIQNTKISTSNPEESPETLSATVITGTIPQVVVVCSPLNARHGHAIAAALSKSAKASAGEVCDHTLQ